MEQHDNALDLLDMLPRPAFFVRNGIIERVNPAASSYFIETNTRIQDLLVTGVEEYAAFDGGRLYLNLRISGQSLGFSVSHVGDGDLFRMEQDCDNRELQAMALAARELRDPLASVMITAERLYPVTALKEDSETRNQVARINRGLLQILRVIGNMSDAIRYTAGTPTQQEVRNICAVLQDIFDRAEELVCQAGITLEYTGYPETVYTLVDTEKVERAVYNILSNALKFTPRGGSIHATLTRRKNKLYLSVQDSGSGIPQQLRGEIHSRYTREPAMEDGRFGIGLGMVLIRSTATAHNGTVLIDQPAQCGTRITMSFAIDPGAGTKLRAPTLQVDYAGERDHGLLELSDILPAQLYE